MFFGRSYWGYIYFAPVRLWSIVMTMSVCLSVCLFVCVCVCLCTHITQKPRGWTSSNFLCTLPVAVAQSSSDGVAIRHVLPVLRMTSCFHILGLMSRVGHCGLLAHSLGSQAYWGVWRCVGRPPGTDKAAVTRHDSLGAGCPAPGLGCCQGRWCAIRCVLMLVVAHRDKVCYLWLPCWNVVKVLLTWFSFSTITLLIGDRNGICRISKNLCYYYSPKFLYWVTVPNLEQLLTKLKAVKCWHYCDPLMHKVAKTVT